jgi:methyl coenzyme M reductase subunit D
MDLLEEKLKRVQFKDCFPTYTGKNNKEEVSDYIKQIYLKANKIDLKVRTVQVFKTVVTDTELIKNVCHSVLKFSIEAQLKSVGLFM